MPNRKFSRQTGSERGLISEDASPQIRAMTHCYLVGGMSAALCNPAAAVDLENRSAARSALEAAGYGENSVAFLLDRAIDAARISIAAASHKGRADV